VSASAGAPIPSGIDWHEMAAIGLVGVTAFEGLRMIAALSWRRIVVTGAGDIGSAATAIARAQDASVMPWSIELTGSIRFVRSARKG
jgi:NADPH2:quinone reductase